VGGAERALAGCWDGWTLVDGGPKPEETNESFLRFRLNVAPGATEHLKVEERHRENEEFKLDDIDNDKLAILIENKSVDANFQQAIRSVLDRKNAVELLESQISSRQREVDAIGKDQVRLRENMKALKGTSEEKALVQRYARQLGQQEDRLIALQKELSDLNEKKDRADEDLDQTIQSIVMDETM
jgi:hypothetical protein